jgi:hypothetical protein
MKHLLLLTIGTLFFISSYAQSNKEDIDMIQSIYGKEKKAIIADFIMPADDAKKDAFWKLYDEYELKRKANGQKRIALLEKYANVYTSMDDKTTDEIMKELLSLQKSVDGLIIEYYNKIKKSVGSKQAAQFYQIEGYLLSATRIYIMGNIPFIGELEKIELPAPVK